MSVIGSLGWAIRATMTIYFASGSNCMASESLSGADENFSRSTPLVIVTVFSDSDSEHSHLSMFSFVCLLMHTILS